MELLFFINSVKTGRCIGYALPVALPMKIDFLRWLASIRIP